MKKYISFVSLICASTMLAYGDYAPSSADAIAVHCTIQSGSGYFATSGESIAFTIPETQQFYLAGIENVDDGYGTYVWTKTGTNTATMLFNDISSEVSVIYSLTFNNRDEGTFSANAPGVGTQSGTFIWRYMLKPSEVSETLAGGKPVIKVENNTANITFQIKESADLESWSNPEGTATNDGNGKITFSTTASSTNKFFKLDLLTE